MKSSFINKVALLGKKIWYFIYMYLGVGYINQMIFRKKSYEEKARRPSNILLWLIGIYTGFFGVMMQRYELRVNRLMTRYTSYVEQLSPDVQEEILQGFINLQSDSIPIEPLYLDWSSFSTIWKKEPHWPIFDDIANMVPSYITSPNVDGIHNYTGNKLTISRPFFLLSNCSLFRLHVLADSTYLNLQHSNEINTLYIGDSKDVTIGFFGKLEIENFYIEKSNLTIKPFDTYFVKGWRDIEFYNGRIRESTIQGGGMVGIVEVMFRSTFNDSRLLFHFPELDHIYENDFSNASLELIDSTLYDDYSTLKGKLYLNVN